LPPGDPFRLRAVSGSDTLANIKTYIDQARLHQGWCIVNFHDVVNSPGSGQQDLAIFSGVMDYLQATGTPVRTPTQILKGMI
jgi:hypothetical protein